MKLSCRWLKKFVEFDPDPEWLSHELTMMGLEVDAHEKVKYRDGQEDTVLEIGLTPNRSDCLSMMGLARELAALTGNPLKDLRFNMVESGDAVDDLTSVALEEPEMCPRYIARVITGVKIGPSPTWLVDSLEAIGQRSINNVVDVTNYVMFELGHPLHAFDYDLLDEKRIVVRKAGRGEIFDSDRTQCKLHEGVLVIADAKRAVALAGIMGGINSEVKENTQNLLLECAYFNSSLIRKTAKEYKIHSESSHRFERGTDPNSLGKVIDYAASLIAELSGGKIARGRIDHYPVPVQNAEVNLRIGKVNNILGSNLTAEEIKKHLEKLCFDVSAVDDGLLRVSVPTFRTDVEREIDLIEEVARMNGYNKIRPILPTCSVVEPKQPPLFLFKQKIGNIFSGFGLQEIITYSFINKEYFSYLQLPEGKSLRNGVPIINPISQEMDVLRTTLVPSMLETIARNISLGTSDLMLFETGKVFQKSGNGSLPNESFHLIAAITGRTNVNLWDPKDSNRNFYSIKGILQAFLERINAEPLEIEHTNCPYFVSGKSVRIRVGEENIGDMGEVHPRVTELFKIDQRVFLFELALEPLFKKIRHGATMQSIPRFPSTLRDIAVIVENTTTAEEIALTIKEVGGDILKEVSIFDHFEGGNIPKDKKSLAYSMVFRSDTRTLTDSEVDELQQNILNNLERKFGARLRG